MSFGLPRTVIRTETQVFIDAIRIDDLARVHLPIRVPNGFEFTKGFNQFWTEHLVEKFRFRLAVSVLTGDRPSVASNEIGCLFHERTPFFDSRCAHQIEVDAAVNASLTKVPIKSRVVLVFVVELAKIAQISADLLRGNRRVFPAFPSQWLARNECGCS